QRQGPPPDEVVLRVHGFEGFRSASGSRGAGGAPAASSPRIFPKNSGICTPPTSRMMLSMGGSDLARLWMKPAAPLVPAPLPPVPLSQTTTLSNLMFEIAVAVVFE